MAPGFFETLGIPLVAGRDLERGDGIGAPQVAVVNENFVRYFFKDGSALGRRFGQKGGGKEYEDRGRGARRQGRHDARGAEALRVRALHAGAERRRAHLLRPLERGERFAGRQLTAAVARVDPTLPVTGLKTMRAQIGESLFVERMVAALSAAFGLLATLLAAIGLYGVMSYAVAQRTREIGLRVALGADRRSVLMLVLREVAVLAGLGIAIGLPGGYGLGRAVESQLFGLPRATR